MGEAVVPDVAQALRHRRVQAQRRGHDLRVVERPSAGVPAAEATVWTNDLTHDYVHENSAYST